MISQRLVNRFPSWSHVRTNPSSLGNRIFGVWGEYFDFAYAENKRILEDIKILKRGLGIGYVYEIALNEDDALQQSIAQGGQQVWVYPTVTGTIGVTDYPITRVESVEELLWSIPNRISSGVQYGIEDFVIYTDDRQGTIVNNAIDIPAHLIIYIGPSTNFYKKTRLRNLKSSGKHQLIIRGEDINRSTIEEFIDIPDDGYYVSRNIYTAINDVIAEGFDGPITITIGTPQEEYVDSFKVCVTDREEGALKLSLETQIVSAVNHAKLYYYTNIFDRGEDYRDGTVRVDPNEIDKWEQYLMTSAGAAYTPIDMAINPNNGRLYVLDSIGRVHLYEHKITSFEVPSLQSSLTKSSYLEVVPIKYWARLDETMNLFTRFTRIRFPIQSVIIKRISPSSTVEYLQANLTWSGSSYSFPGIFVDSGLSEDSWVDFGFTSLFDEAGQWEFYTTVKTQYDTTVSYVGVMVDQIDAAVSFSTGVSSPLAIWFTPDDKIAISSSVNGPGSESNSVYVFTEYSDVYLPDGSNQILYLKETYDSVEVS